MTCANNIWNMTNTQCLSLCNFLYNPSITNCNSTTLSFLLLSDCNRLLFCFVSWTCTLLGNSALPACPTSYLKLRHSDVRAAPEGSTVFGSAGSWTVVSAAETSDSKSVSFYVIIRACSSTFSLFMTSYNRGMIVFKIMLYKSLRVRSYSSAYFRFLYYKTAFKKKRKSFYSRLNLMSRWRGLF